VIDIDQADIAELYERKLTLVRPDGHSAWRGDTLPDDVHALIDTVRGARLRQDSAYVAPTRSSDRSAIAAAA
jgi:hypothetical protein